MALGQLTCSRGEASIPMVQSIVQSTETPPKANPPSQSSSSVETLTSTTSNYIEHT